MHPIHIVFVAIVGIGFDSSPLPKQNNCRARPFLEQARDAVTVRRLEAAWQRAYVTGDVEVEKCLLDRGFIEILAGGEIRKLDDELATTKRQRTNSLAHFPSGRSKLLMHGNAAVAYGRINTNLPRVGSDLVPFADYFVWDGGSWHVYFSQQTKRPPKANW
jgi:hypothetical protein